MRILIVDDEPSITEMLEEYLQIRGHQASTANSVEEAIRLLQQGEMDLVLTDMRMPGISGMALLDHIAKGDHDTSAIVMTGHGSIDSAIQAMKAGAQDYILKPFRLHDIHAAILRAGDRMRLQHQARLLGMVSAFAESLRELQSLSDCEAWYRMICDGFVERGQLLGAALFFREKLSGRWACYASAGRCEEVPLGSPLHETAHGDTASSYPIYLSLPDGARECVGQLFLFGELTPGVSHAVSVSCGMLEGLLQRWVTDGWMAAESLPAGELGRQFLERFQPLLHGLPADEIQVALRVAWLLGENYQSLLHAPDQQFLQELSGKERSLLFSILREIELLLMPSSQELELGTGLLSSSILAGLLHGYWLQHERIYAPRLSEADSLARVKQLPLPDGVFERF